MEKDYVLYEEVFWKSLKKGELGLMLLIEDEELVFYYFVDIEWEFDDVEVVL